MRRTVPASAISQILLDRLGFGIQRCRVDQIRQIARPAFASHNL
jgi:hypothetical protein